MRYREDNKRKRGYDYGILMRANPSKRDPRLWIVFAGVGRVACVASRVLVFEEKMGRGFWDRLRGQGNLASFAVLFEVKFSLADNKRPSAIRVLEIVPIN